MERLRFSEGVVLPILRKRELRVFLPIVAVLIFSCAIPAAGVTPRIMPLGDSITRGWYGSMYGWGYRQPLYVNLTNGGYNFDFVGGLTDGSFPDPQHMGLDGWRASQILDGVKSGWLITYQPDVVLLHIGTNDVSWNDVNFNDVNEILDVIDGYEVSSGKHVTVFLALIINRRIDSSSTKRAQTTQFNSDVNNMAMSRIANGDDIIIVDMESALDYNIGVDMADEVHPNDAGYAKMANVWHEALADYFNTLSLAISGYVLKAYDNTPVEGLLIKTDDNDISALTDANGYYQLPVDYNWSGTIIPQKNGYIVDPNKETFTNVTQNYNDVNYTAIPITFKITGFVFEQDSITPVSGVNVSADNGGGATLTDADGYYEIVVGYNWSGNVTSSKYAWAFEPNSRHYEVVDQNYTADQNYTGNELDFRITGYIRNECDVPIEGVLVDADNGGDDTTDANGFYEVWVDSAWSGVVTPGRQHYTFDPNWISYVNVLADQPDQNYIADNIYDLDCDGSIGWGDVAVMADNWLKTGAGDIDKDGDVDFSDFAEFGVVW